MKRTANLSALTQVDAAFRSFYEAAKQIVASGKELILEIREPSKTREQENKYHRQIRDVAEQSTFHGEVLNEEDWKRLLVDAFKHDTKYDPELKDEWEKFGELRLYPALNHTGFVAVGEQTKKFTVKLANAFIDWLYAYGAEFGVDMS